jgi:hypothetical protein
LPEQKKYSKFEVLLLKTEAIDISKQIQAFDFERKKKKATEG